MRKAEQLPSQRTTRCDVKRERDKQVQCRRFQRFRGNLLKQRRREAVEQDQALCADCAAEGMPYRLQGVELHHRIPRAIAPHLTYDPNNCVFLCKSHHSQHTARE